MPADDVASAGVTARDTDTDNAVSFLQTIVYGLPGLPLAILFLPLFVTVPKFYADDLGLGFATVGGILLAVRLVDVVSDPVVGILSDRTRGRFGRRRPWLVAGAPLVVAGAWFLFMPPSDVGVAHLLLSTLALYLGGTMILLPYTAWAAELSGDHHERSRIAASREGALVIGTLAAMAVPALFGLDTMLIMDATALAIAALIPLTVAMTVLVLPDPPVTRSGPPEKPLAARFRNILAPFRLRAFRQLIAAYFVNGVAYGLPATLFLLYVEHVLQAESWAWPLLIVYFASAIVALPAWLALSRRIGKRRTWTAAMTLAVLGFWPAAFLGPGDLGWFVAICVVTGMPLGAELALPPSMQADVVDLDSSKSGAPRAGTLFGLWGIATKVPLALGVGIAFPVLDLAGFDGSRGANDADALFVLAALYGLAPVAFKVAAIAIIRRYRLDADAHARLATATVEPAT